MGAIPHHLHQSDAFAKLVGQKGKPEAYYFPPQYNQIENAFPFTFMGLEPGTTKDDVRRCLENWSKGDNGILVPLARVPAATGHRLADQSRNSSRTRLARHLRAASQQRRLCHVPVSRGRPRCRSRPSDERRQARIPRRPRLSGQHARLGGERESGVRDDESRFHARGAGTGNRPKQPATGSNGCATARRGIRPRS